MVLNCVLAISVLITGPLSELLEAELPCSALRTSSIITLGSTPKGCSVDAEIQAGTEDDSEHTLDIQFSPDCPEGLEVDSWKFSIIGKNIVNSFEPRGFGRLANKQFDVSFPSMQFSSLFAETGCIYLGIHDGKAFPKRFAFDGKVTMSCSYLGSAELGNGGRTSLPFKVHVIEGACTWKDMADIYLQFASRTSWYAKGIERKANRPEWIHDVPFWINSHWQTNDVFETKGGKPSVVLERVRQFKELVGMEFPMILHWYEWDLLGYVDEDFEKCASEIVCGFDSHYPKYFPEREGFLDAAASLRNQNVYTVPYINGRLFDKALEDWEKIPESKAAAVLLKDGRYVDENYGNNIHFAAICPATEYWQEYIAAISGRLANEFSVSGIYIDEVAAADPVPCHNPDHEHAPGGGSSWTSGYNDMMDAVRRDIGSDRLIITESNVEQLIGSVDTFLSLVAYHDVDAVVPAFQYIYSNGMALTAGAEFYQQDVTFNGGIWFMKKLMKMFLLGTQLGWMALGGRDNQRPPMNMLEVLSQLEYRPLLSALVKLIKQRMDPTVISFFGDGRLVMDINKDSYVWELEGRALVMSCNPTADVSQFSAEINLEGVLINRSPVSADVYEDDEWITIIVSASPDALIVDIQIHPRSCALIHVWQSENGWPDDLMPQESTS